MRVQGAVIVITGVSRGLGRATAIKLKERGATVIGLDMTAGDIRDEIDDFHVLNLCDRARIDTVTKDILARFGDIDILINNAGVLTLETGDADVNDSARYAMDVNLFGAWQLTAGLLPSLLRRHGRVINVASMFALVNVPYIAAYAASKRALFAYSDILRANYRGRLHVTTVFPGFIDTAIHRPASGIGLSVKRLVNFVLSGRTVFSMEEPLDRAAAGLVAACERRAVRNRGLTPFGSLTMYCARWLPSVVDWVVAARLAALVRSGDIVLRPDLIECEIAAILPSPAPGTGNANPATIAQLRDAALR